MTPQLTYDLTKRSVLNWATNNPERVRQVAAQMGITTKNPPTERMLEHLQRHKSEVAVRAKPMTLEERCALGRKEAEERASKVVAMV